MKTTPAFLSLLSAACLSAGSVGDKAAFEKVCGACHATSMVSDLKTESEWIETVANMTGLGAKGSREDFGGVMSYLAANFTKVNINTATAEQIAPVLDISLAAAKAAVEYRARHGNFASLADLGKVPEVDAVRLAQRKDRIAFQ